MAGSDSRWRPRTRHSQSCKYTPAYPPTCSERGRRLGLHKSVPLRGYGPLEILSQSDDHLNILRFTHHPFRNVASEWGSREAVSFRCEDQIAQSVGWSSKYTPLTHHLLRNVAGERGFRKASRYGSLEVQTGEGARWCDLSNKHISPHHKPANRRNTTQVLTHQSNNFACTVYSCSAVQVDIIRSKQNCREVSSSIPRHAAPSLLAWSTACSVGAGPRRIIFPAIDHTQESTSHAVAWHLPVQTWACP